jgi:hypothetical protein
MTTHKKTASSYLRYLKADDSTKKEIERLNQKSKQINKAIFGLEYQIRVVKANPQVNFALNESSEPKVCAVRNSIGYYVDLIRLLDIDKLLKMPSRTVISIKEMCNQLQELSNGVTLPKGDTVRISLNADERIIISRIEALACKASQEIDTQHKYHSNLDRLIARSEKELKNQVKQINRSSVLFNYIKTTTNLSTPEEKKKNTEQAVAAEKFIKDSPSPTLNLDREALIDTIIACQLNDTEVERFIQLLRQIKFRSILMSAELNGMLTTGENECTIEKAKAELAYFKEHENSINYGKLARYVQTHKDNGHILQSYHGGKFTLELATRLTAIDRVFAAKTAETPEVTEPQEVVTKIKQPMKSTIKPMKIGTGFILMMSIVLFCMFALLLSTFTGFFVVTNLFDLAIRFAGLYICSLWLAFGSKGGNSDG